MHTAVNTAWAVLLTALTAVWAVQTRPATADRLAVVPVALGLAVVVALRHRRPGPMLLLALAVGVVQLLLDVPANPLSLALVLVVFTNAAAHDGWASRLAMAAALCAPPIAAVRWPPAEDLPAALAGTLLPTLTLVTAWVLGYSVRTRRAYRAELARRAARQRREREALAREREARAAAAVAAERSRIARELHDVVAHDVAVIVVQADGASRVLDTDPGQARTALGTIADTGRQALAELRRLVDVLRPSDEADAYAPQPSVAELADLVARARDDGLPVDLRVEGAERPLPRSVQLAVYHLVRQALSRRPADADTDTDARAGSPAGRRSGARAGVRVRLRYAEDAVTLLVEDDGASPRPAPAPSPDSSPGADHALPRMRERVAMLGGSLTVRPRPDGGRRLRAVLPLRREPGPAGTPDDPPGPRCGGAATGPEGEPGGAAGEQPTGPGP